MYRQREMIAKLLNTHFVLFLVHEHIITWKCFPYYWPFVMGIQSLGGFLQKGPMIQSFDVFFVSLIKLLNKQLSFQWFEMPSCCHCNIPNYFHPIPRCIRVSRGHHSTTEVPIAFSSVTAGDDQFYHSRLSNLDLITHLSSQMTFEQNVQEKSQVCYQLIVSWEIWLWFKMCEFQTQLGGWYLEYSSKWNECQRSLLMISQHWFR